MPDALLGISHGRRIDVDLALRLVHPWDGKASDVWGRPVPEGVLEARVREVVTNLQAPGPRQDLLTLVPPRHARDNEVGMAPVYSLQVGGLRRTVLTVEREWDDRGGWNTEEVHLEYPAFRSGRNDATLLATAPTVRDGFAHPVDSDRFLDAGRRVVDTLEASFAFGGAQEDFAEPEPDDPLHRAWGVTYYGPSLVARLGRERVASAPAHRVAFDARGGGWVQLVPLPFVPSPEKDRARRAVERHLRLDELVPPGGEGSPG